MSVETVPFDTASVETAMARLEAHRSTLVSFHLRDAFDADPERFRKFSLRLDHLLFDFSKNILTDETVGLLLAWAEAAGLPAMREAMFSGAAINTTENRAVLHVALRNLSHRPIHVDGEDVMPGVNATLARMRTFSDGVRTGLIAGRGGRFTDVVNIGIGGSDLGPAMVVQALAPYAGDGPRLHFVSNVDGADIAETLKRLDPSRTLVLVASKTFTTLETMTNAATARDWLAGALGEDAVRVHFAAMSTALDRTGAFGIAPDRTFGFADWVGGRYSVWSAIGLSVALAVGFETFARFIQGGYEMDEHFRTAPLAHNMPVLLGTIGAWYRNFFGYPTHAILPYDQRLSRLPAHIQQLDMESNGKRVDRNGEPLARASGPVVFGEPGTNGQHAFFQLLHQGTDVVPCDFLVAARPAERIGDHHAKLVANCFAQSEALARGRTLEEVTRRLEADGLDRESAARIAPHRVFPGNRPSNTLLFRALDPRTLGRLLALYEHKVFVQGVLWNVNSFDQWGVELGKERATALLPAVGGAPVPEDADGSTRGLLGIFHELREADAAAH